MLPPLKNLKSHFPSEESTILPLIEKEIIVQPTECTNCPHSKISPQKRRWCCTKKTMPKRMVHV
ncbi:hypothetical protein HZS_720 [Henneguya salminicola]|nr:hypothetical protein HZS_720 [Henneguya salminicola]